MAQSRQSGHNLTGEALCVVISSTVSSRCSPWETNVEHAGEANIVDQYNGVE